MQAEQSCQDEGPRTMLFNSFEFIIFLPAVFCLYWFLSKGRLSLQNLIIVVSSYVFYAWLDARFLGLIMLTSLSAWLTALYVDASGGKRTGRWWVSLANIVLNIGILCVFKYLDFFGENFARLFQLLGFEYTWVTRNLMLPIGISFYTFTALSYSLDVYMGKLKAERNPLTVFSYVAFFPQLLAGPIARATQLMPQFRGVRVFDYASAVEGMRQILWGLFKKVAIADNISAIVAGVFDNYQEYSASTLLLGAFYFTIQIYCDFSGYSDMATGLARLFGIRLLPNFSTPYFSRNVAEFWRRWHISLNMWFRDYIYIPLGGSRVSRPVTIRNTMIVFIICGLWHGASWTFIVWSIYHGLLCSFLILTGGNKRYKGVICENSTFPSLREVAGVIMTFLAVVFGRIISRSETLSQGVGYLCGIFDASVFSIPDFIDIKVLLLTIFMFVVEWLGRKHEFAFNVGAIRPAWVRSGIYLSVLLLIFLFGRTSENFIYFNF